MPVLEGSLLYIGASELPFRTFPIFLFDLDIRILLFHLLIEHRRTVPRPRCPCAQRCAPYDDSVNFKLFGDRFYRYDAARPVAGSSTLVFVFQLSPL